MNETPRTDAEIGSQDPYWFGRVKGDFARQLELRCALWKRAAKAQRRDANKAIRQRQVSEEYLGEKWTQEYNKLKVAMAALDNIRGLSGFNPNDDPIRDEIYDWADNALNQIKS